MRAIALAVAMATTGHAAMIDTTVDSSSTLVMRQVYVDQETTYRASVIGGDWIETPYVAVYHVDADGLIGDRVDVAMFTTPADGIWDDITLPMGDYWFSVHSPTASTLSGVRVAQVPEVIGALGLAAVGLIRRR